MKKFFVYVLVVVSFLLMFPAILVFIAGASMKDDTFDDCLKNIMLSLACINSAAIWWAIFN